ncbi:M48 family metallopeptidase [Parapedobacter tibetensis]|uniref:M48 family metallopeptidase n=1 Tax=Parapedobacter tibetensis TaxID=2972951 RepID=UPI00214D6139|nr:M48 family metallopeptidase [Parapedobacter tibetensis]
MAYLGIQTQIRNNNRNSILLLMLFPVLLLAMVYAILFFSGNDTAASTAAFMQSLPFVIIGISIWFAIAYFANSAMIRMATGAQPLQRRENKRVYNLVENLSISQGMKMPHVCVIEDPSLNAYASGINEKTYTITLSRGIINTLDDAELESVIAHELAHIRNRDTRLLIISIIFVGIFAFVSQVAFRSFLYRGLGRRSGKNNNGGVVLIVVIVVSAVAYFLSLLLKFGISRKREYMADAGAAEMTKDPAALASALRKIAANPHIEAVKNEDVAQLFIEHPKPKRKGSFSLNNLFATHPPIEDRIRILENF